jgi:HEAT repeat protein
MLEGLDKIKWHKLQDAYGSAEDTPTWIRALISDDGKARQQAQNGLHNNLLHNGFVYQATPHAVPFLLELLQNEQVQDRDWLLIFLGQLAMGASFLNANVQLEHEREQVKAEIECELGYVKKTHSAVRKGLEDYLRLLEHPDANMRMNAAYTLACTVSDKARKQIVAKLLQLIRDKEQEPLARASMVRALMISRPPLSLIKEFEGIIKEDESFLVRVNAAMVAARLAQVRTPIVAIDLLFDTLKHPKPIEEDYAKLPWQNNGIVADVVRFLSFAGVDVLGKRLPQLISVMNHSVDGKGAFIIANALIAMVFNWELPAPDITANALTPEQRLLLTGIADSDNAWTYTNMEWILQDVGLPYKRAKLRAFLQ